MGELSLSTLAKLAEVIGASTIVTGLIFGWIQLRQYRVQQRDAVATNLMQTFYSRDLAQAIALLQTVPDGIRQVELRARGEDRHHGHHFYRRRTRSHQVPRLETTLSL